MNDDTSQLIGTMIILGNIAGLFIVAMYRMFDWLWG